MKCRENGRGPDTCLRTEKEMGKNRSEKMKLSSKNRGGHLDINNAVVSKHEYMDPHKTEETALS